MDKVWGKKVSIYKDDYHEVDLLYLKKDTFCSLHYHLFKCNEFILLKGKVKIELDYKNVLLKGDKGFLVAPNELHRFVVLEDSIMIENAYTKCFKLAHEDIYRTVLGGNIIDGKKVPILK